MLNSNALVLVMDGLGSGNLGPYGNTWQETHAWNRLAAASSLAETALVDSIDPGTLYRSYMLGQHALTPTEHSSSLRLPDQLDQRGVESWLVTDDPAVADDPTLEGFCERVILPTPVANGSASVIEETHLAQFFATLIGVMEQAEPPFLIWAHARAMLGPWDAPYQLRCQLADDEDPEPPDFVAAPDRCLERDFDPDELLGIVHANAAQVAVLDVCLGILLDAIWSSPLAATTGIVATSARGFPLGEQLWVGPSDRTLSANLLQVPWIMHWPSGQDATGQNATVQNDTVQNDCERIQALVQPPDLHATLLDWFGVPFEPHATWGQSLLSSRHMDRPPLVRDQAATSDGAHRLIRVPNWSLRQAPSEPTHLFVKPDDRWEVNEVSDRCHNVVDQLTCLLEQFEQAASTGRRTDLADLPPDLR